MKNSIATGQCALFRLARLLVSRRRCGACALARPYPLETCGTLLSPDSSRLPVGPVRPLDEDDERHQRALLSPYDIELQNPEDDPTQSNVDSLYEFSNESLPHIPLRPFRNQVGGHCAIYKFTKRAVCKVHINLTFTDSRSDDALAPRITRKPVL